MPGTDTEVDVCICFSNNCNEGGSTDWGIHGLRTPSKVFLPSYPKLSFIRLGRLAKQIVG